jgi:hypothetical protein
MKKLFVLPVLLLCMVSMSLFFPVVVSADDLESQWELASDATVDGVTGPQNYKTYTVNLSMRGNKFVGRYIGNVAGNAHPNSIFTGETSVASGTKVITFHEYDADYHVAYTGKEISPNTYEGTWYSSTAQSGSFKLQPKPNK